MVEKALNYEGHLVAARILIPLNKHIHSVLVKSIIPINIPHKEEVQVEEGAVAANCFGSGYNGHAVHLNMIGHY